MLPSSSDREPRNMGYNLDIYLKECTRHDDDTMELLDSFLRLVKADLSMTEIGDDHITEAIMKSGILPDYDLTIGNPRFVRETFALAPLRFLAPYIEMLYASEEIERWYEKAVEVAGMLTGEHTNGSCLAGARRLPVYKLRALDADPCSVSLICPRKEMQRLLGEAAVNYNKSDLEYTHNFDRYVQAADAKIGIAVRQGLLEAYYASALLDIRNRQVSN